MRSRAFFFFTAVCCLGLSLQADRTVVRIDAAKGFEKPEVRNAVAFAVSAPVSEIAHRGEKGKPRDAGVAGLLQLNSPQVPGSPTNFPHDLDAFLTRPSAVPMPTPLLSFDGLSNFDNIDAYGLVIIPPDITGDVGPNHYVQAVNALVRVFDKAGTPITAPFRMSSLFSGLGTPCSTRDDGDPIVAYDPLADRWLLSQYCNQFPPFRQMIAISKTGDPNGAYFVYEYVMPNVRLNDFSKFGVWTDAYYMSTEEYTGSDYIGAGVFAFDRARMLAGDPAASYIYFSRPSDSTDRRRNLLPSDLDGIRPPPGRMPNIFVSYTATEYGDAQDAVRLFDFHADFETPASSTFTERPDSPLPVAAFDPTSPAGRADITQPDPGEKLDSNSDRVNYRVAYRNYGMQESLVFNQTVRLTQEPEPYRAGVRLYELRRSASTMFTVADQSTIGDTTSSRWIGSAAQDHLGDVAVGYNFVADGKPPSVLYTGRLNGGPSGVFRDEGSIVAGDGVQKAFGWRWGDYATLTVDPVDDCTFWLSGEYYTKASQQVSDFTWLTRIGTFRFSECPDAPRSTISGSVTNAVTGAPISGAIVSAAAFSRSTSPAGSYQNMLIIPGTYTVKAAAKGYRTQSINLTLSAGDSAVQNFALQPEAVIESSDVAITSESCAINGAAEPGETLSYAISLRNNGVQSTQNLTAALQASGSISSPGGPQNYGSLTAGGPAVTRNFSFTISPGISCGSTVMLTLVLQDGAENLGAISIPLQTGVPRIAFRENFDHTPQARLPLRWTRSAAGNTNMPDAPRNWRISMARAASGSKSVFSPDLNQVGVGEMVSPVFLLSTPNARLTFQNWYDLETTFLRNRLYDGSVLEIKVGDNSFTDIVAAGGAFESGGYDGTIDSCCSNPLGGHMGWSGRSGVNQTSEFITTAVRLPASAAGQKVQLRWRIGTDVGTFREGQYIDDILITDGYTCNCIQ